ncbi:HipA family kinase [Chromobacterium haemolyticum]
MACDYIPSHWQYENDERDILVDFDINQARSKLERFRLQEFWEAI